MRELLRVEDIVKNVPYTPRMLQMHIFGGVKISYPVEGLIEIQKPGVEPYYLNPYDKKAFSTLRSATYKNANTLEGMAVKNYYSQVRALHSRFYGVKEPSITKREF